MLAINGAYQWLDEDPPAGSDDSGFVELISIGLGIPSAFMFPIYVLSARHGRRHVRRCRAELAKPPPG